MYGLSTELTDSLTDIRTGSYLILILDFGVGYLLNLYSKRLALGRSVFSLTWIQTWALKKLKSGSKELH